MGVNGSLTILDGRTWKNCFAGRFGKQGRPSPARKKARQNRAFSYLIGRTA
jgi:hypothetical protein